MARKVILLRGNAREESGVATGNITPGFLLEPTATGFQAHSAAGGAAAAIFARSQHENDGAGVDTAIASGDDVTAIFPELGAKVNAATDDTITRGERVTSAGNGKVALADSTDVAIGVAAEDSDLSGTIGRVAIYVAPGA